MKYYIDTEFIEGPQKEKFPISLFRKNTPPTIDLISIGIVAEDGREYYAVSKDFNLEEAWNRFDLKLEKGDYTWDFGMTDSHVIWIPDENGRLSTQKKDYWVRDNVLLSIYKDWVSGDARNRLEFTYTTMKYLLSIHGKSNKEIAKEARNFVYLENKDKGGQLVLGSFIPNEYPNPEFYAYFADYDWVVFCWLFGRMMDLPNGFPYYCKDLKQILDEKYPEPKLSELKCNPFVGYPVQEDEHNALADARWDKKLHEFLIKS